MSAAESSPPSIGFAVAKSLPHRGDISRYSLRTVADTGARKLRGPPHRRSAVDRSSCTRLDRVLCPTVVTQRRTSSVNRVVIEMTLATATSALESRFGPFLYAAVREDPDGGPLTVLSVLARLDIDPWEEAARLAQLGRSAMRALVP